LEISNFEFEVKFGKSKIKILNESLKFLTGKKQKLLIKKAREIEPIWMKNFVRYCFFAVEFCQQL
jgi:hypothetical protein